MATTIQEKLKDLLDQPMTYAQIESATGIKEGLTLAIALAQMVVAKTIHKKEPSAYAQAWPVYSAKPIPRNFILPKRDGYIQRDRSNDAAAL